MQDKFDKAWKDKLGGYQAPADPQDWAAMSAMLDAKEKKRAGFFWWSLLGVAMLFTVGGVGYRYVTSTSNGNSTGIATTNEPSSIQGDATHNEHSNSNVASDNGGEGNNNSGLATAITGTEDDNAAAASSGTITENGSNANKNAGSDNPNSKANAKPDNNTTTAAVTSNASPKYNKKAGTRHNKTVNTSNTNTPKGNSASATSGSKTNRNTKGSTTAWNRPVSAAYEEEFIVDNDGSTNITLKQLKQLPNLSPVALRKDSGDITITINMKMPKPRAVSHYLGISTGMVFSRVDRSGDFRPGYNVGLQYTMMIKNRAGLHAGIAFRQYNYFTDLVACNYDIYQCPNSYTSTLQTIDLHIGAQVNLVKTNTIEWYVMGGINNQFMMRETFEYNLPKVDTSYPGPPPLDPPTNTSFVGAGVSDFDESISQSMDATDPSFNPNRLETGRFLRERYLGAWYVGTGITWKFANRMNLQVEPTIGRSLQFVGIQDKKLWNGGINVRLNVRLGK